MKVGTAYSGEARWKKLPTVSTSKVEISEININDPEVIKNYGAAILKLITNLYEYMAALPDTQYTRPDWGSECLKDYKQGGAKIILVKDILTQEPVGLLSVCKSTYDPVMLCLMDAYIEESHRGTGVFSELLKLVTDHATKCGFSKLGLTVALCNTNAKAIHEHNGFTPRSQFMVKGI